MGNVTFNGGGLESNTFSNSGTVTITNGIFFSGGPTFINEPAATVINAGGVIPQGFLGISSGTFDNQGTLDQNAGTLTFATDFQNIGGIVNVNAGNMVITGRAELQNGQLNVATGSTLSFDNGDPTNPFGGNIAISGTLTGSGGGIIALNSGNYSAITPQATQAPAVLNFPSGMVQVGTVAFHLARSATITNTGFLNFVGSVGHGQVVMTNQGTITIAGTATLPLQTFVNGMAGELDFVTSGALTVCGNSFINDGVINQNAGTVTMGVRFQDSGGIINVNSGKMILSTTTILQNTMLNIATGSTLTFNNGDTTNPYGIGVSISGTLTGSGGGIIALDSGDFSALAPDSTPVPVVLDFPAGMVQVGNVAFDQASSATITNTGFLDFIGSVGHGATRMINQGTITITGTAALPLATFVNDTTGVLDLETNASIIDGQGNSTNLTNKGIIRKSASAGVTVLTASFFNDGGALDIESGSLSFQEGSFGYIAGPIQIAAGSTLNFHTSNGIYIQGTLTSTGAGSVTLSSGWFAGPTTNTSNFSEDNTVPSELDFAPNTLFITGTGFIDDNNGLGTTLDNAGYLYYQNSAIDAVFNFGQTQNSGHMFIEGNTAVFDKGVVITNEPGGIIDFTAPTVIAPSINLGFDNQGLVIFNLGGGTMNLATPFPVNGNTGLPGFTNDGTLEVTSGTLIYPSIDFGNSSTVAAGGVYQIDAGASLTTEVPVALTTNNATVILGGAGATFPDLHSLTTNNGTLEVLGGATFTTAGNLINTGTLSVGGNVAITGSFTQSQVSDAAPTLDFPVAAAPGNPKSPHLTVALGATLAGNLTAEYANGFAAMPNTLFNVATFTGPAVGSFASTSGVGPAFTANVSTNGIALTSTLFGSTDLGITSMSAPSTASPGQPISITWNVTNNSSDTPTTSGSWVDSVYLSANGTVDASDILLGSVTETGPLAPGASYVGTLNTMFPAVKGMNNIIVVVDAGQILPDFDRTNNVASSAVTSSIPVLTLGGNVNGTLSAGQSVVYQLTLPGGNDVNVTAALGSLLASDLEISDGAVPTPATAQFVAPLSSVSPTISTTIAHPQPGVYYITLRGQSTISGAQPFTISATAVAPGATAVSPSTLGTGQVSVTVSGSGFGNGAVVSLVDGSGDLVAGAGNVTLRDSDTLLADFDLTGVSPGQYTLRVTSGGVTSNLTNAVTVQPANAAGGISYNLIVQSFARPNIASLAYIQYTNTSNVDVPAQWINLSEPNLSFELVGGSSPNVAAQDFYYNQSIDLMAINQDGEAGVLPPGYSAELMVSIKPLVNDIAHFEFDPLLVGMDSSTLTDDLSTLVGPLPTDLSQTTAEILAAEVNGLSALPTIQIEVRAPGRSIIGGLQMGSFTPPVYPQTPDLTVTDAALNQKMDDIANVLSGAGVYEASFDRLMAYAESAADDFGAITAAHQGGAFGFGTTDPYLFEIVTDNAGDAAFVTPSGTELFETDANGNYVPAAPDSTSTLTVTTTSAGHAWTLNDEDGNVYQFQQGFDFGAEGLVSSITSPSGLVTSFTYDNSNPTTVANPPLISIHYPGNLSTTLAYNSSGLVSSVTDPTGYVTTFGYDDADASGTPLLTTITTPAGTTIIAYTQSPTAADYIDVSNPPSIGTPVYLTSPATAYLPTSIHLPDGSGELFTYDDFGREIGSTLLDGSEPVTFSYDSTGLLETTTYADGSTTQMVVGVGGQSLKEIDGVGNSTYFQYTPDNLLSAIIAPLGSSVEERYADGNLASGTSASGSTGSATYNSLNEPTTLTDGNGNIVGFTYNSGGQLTQTTYPDQSSQQYTYNALGEISQTTQRSGLVLNTTYNAIGDVTQNVYSDGATYSYTYDSLGDLLKATGPNGTTTYTYNVASQITSVTDPSGHIQTYTYDSAGRLSTIAGIAGVISRYTYDSDARLSQIKDGSGNLVVGYTYDFLGRISMETFGNGTKTVYSYDAAGRDTSISNLTALGIVSTSTTYTYNALNLPVTATDQSGNVTTYAYDLAGQLVSVVLPGGRTIVYTHDAEGNRVSATDSGTTTDYITNVLDQYTSAGATTFTYDANGNMSSQTDQSGTTNYAYDEVGQLISSTGPNGDFTYTYDALGQLIAYSDNGATTTLQRDAGGNITAAYDANGDLIDQYQYGYRLVSATGNAGTSLYYDADLAGNITDTTDASGATVNTYSYLPFGEKLTSTGPADNLFTFSGSDDVLDLGDGTYQMGARTYSPALGRFIQPDPAGLVVSSNLYNYVSNGPTTNVDPGGFEETKESPGAPNPTYGYEAGKEIAPNTEAIASIQSTSTHQLVLSVGVAEGPTGPALPGSPKALYTEHPPEHSGTEVTASRWVGGVGTEYTQDGPTHFITPSAYGQTANFKANLIIHDQLGEQTNNFFYYHYAQTPDKYSVFTQNNLAKLNNHETHQLEAARFYRSLHLDGLIKGLTPQQALAKLKALGYNRLDLQHIFLLLAGDPNDLSGPVGFGNAGYVQSGQTFPYTVEFQNEPTASAAAQTVVVTQQLDPNLDWSTFQLTNFSFGSYSINIPAGQTSYSTRVDATATVGLFVDITAILDTTTGLLTVTYTSIDPLTLQPTTDVLAGFLPPDDSTGRGEGSVSYTVQPKASLATGTVTNAQASIVFDTNAAIATPMLTNTIDAAAPTSSVASLPANETSNNFTVNWSGQDDAGGSGIAFYTIYVSTDGGAFAPWLADTTDTSDVYHGSPGHTYAFASTATDNVGNAALIPSVAQATTAVPAIARTLTATAGHPVKFTDAAGQVVTVTLNGPGSGALNFLTALGNADPVSILLTGTTAQSSFTIKNSGALTLGDIQINGTLSSFSAAKANFSGSFDVTGDLGSLTLNAITGGPSTIRVEGSDLSTSFTFGVVHDLSLNAADNIKSLTASQWTNAAFATDSVSAPSITKTQINGDFDANITLTNLSTALGSVTVKGAIAGGTWVVAGGATSITAGSIDAGWSAAFAGNVGTIAIKGAMDGALTALSLKSLTVGGALTDTNLTLSGVSTSSLLGSLSVKGAVSGGTWSISGGSKSITVASIGGGFAATLVGDVGTFAVKGAMTGALTARSIKTMTVGGNLTGSTLQLTGSNAVLGKTLALGSLTVTDSLTNSQVRAVGNIGKVTVGGATGSDVFAGVSPSVTALPTAADLTATSSILSFTTKGKSPFADSFVAASAIGAAVIDDPTTDNGGVPFGVAAQSLQSFSLLQPAHKTFVWTSRQAPSLLETLPGDLRALLL